MISEARKDEKFCVWRPVIESFHPWSQDLVSFSTNFEENSINS